MDTTTPAAAANPRLDAPALVTVNVPPIKVARFRLIANPNPVPCALRAVSPTC